MIVSLEIRFSRGAFNWTIPDSMNLVCNCTKAMHPFPSICPKPRINCSRNKAEPRQQALFGDICSIVKPANILEIGSWMGASAMAWSIASSKYNPKSMVYCVDTWLGSVEHFLSSCGDSWNIDKLSLDVYGPSFFDDFLWNIWEHGCEEKILPFRAASSSALPFFAREGLTFDLVYVDGAHDAYSVFKDVTWGLKIVSSNGLLCGDDFGWDSVRVGLMLSAITHPSPLSFYVKGNDFVVFDALSSHLRLGLDRLGYKRWMAVDVGKIVSHLAFRSKQLLFRIPQSV